MALPWRAQFSGPALLAALWMANSFSATATAAQPKPGPKPAAAAPTKAAASKAPAKAPAPAAPAPADRSADEAAIREVSQLYTRYYNAGDAAALATLWAPDGDYVDDSGVVLAGREAIEQDFRELFSQNPGLRIELSIESIRFLSGETAIENGIARVSMPLDGPPREGRYTVTHVKQDGKWLAASVRDSPYVRPANPEQLKSLAWLIGQWRAADERGELTMHAKWVEGENFIERSYQVKRGQEVVRSGREIIGWDPISGHVVSWHFASDGSTGRDLWLEDGKNWIIEATGTQPDGSESQAINVLEVVDADHFRWQSRERTIGGEILPSIAPVQLERVKSQP